MSFSSTFLVVSSATYGKDDIETTGKIILPQIALEMIIRSGFNDKIMCFVIKNPKTGRSIAVGVQEFSSDPASCVVPNWIMKNIGLEENDKVLVSLTSLPKCTSVVFQPCTQHFLELQNPRVILEHSLRYVPCITEGTILEVIFNKVPYQLKVLSVKPKRMACLYMADVMTSFARPLTDFDHHWGEEDTNETFQGKPRSLK